MIISKVNTATSFENSPVCKGVSYGRTSEVIDGAVIAVSGRYPSSGFLVNEVCKELVYVTSGRGSLISREAAQEFEAGDVVFIDANEAFAWDGNFEGFFATTPRFDPSQYKELPE